MVVYRKKKMKTTRFKLYASETFQGLPSSGNHKAENLEPMMYKNRNSQRA